MNRQLKRRDYEILRTLLRLQLATTALLQRLYFPDLRQARKRLLTLRATYGVITPHTKGLPGNYALSGGRFWRLTEAGLSMLMTEFPDEPIPENHISRTRNASLRFFEHRQGINELYLRLIQSKDKDVDDLRSRCDAVAWRGEYDVVLKYQAVDGVRYEAKSIVPDATLSTLFARYFIELDRSTETRKVCKKKLLAYASALQRSAFGEQFPDALPVIVVYATKTRARADGINEVIDSCGDLPFRAVARPMEEVADWLASAVTDAPGALVTREQTGESAARVKTPGGQDKGSVLLRRIYDMCRVRVATGERIAEDPDFAPVLHDIYGHLQSLAGGS